jgi:hypothetical protein
LENSSSKRKAALPVKLGVSRNPTPRKSQPVKHPQKNSVPFKNFELKYNLRIGSSSEKSKMATDKLFIFRRIIAGVLSIGRHSYRGARTTIRSTRRSLHDEYIVKLT